MWAAPSTLVLVHPCLLRRQIFALPIQLRILLPKLFLKLLIRRPRLPLIHRHINPLTAHSPQQPRPAIPPIPPEQPCPLPLRPICPFKQFFASRLDFEFPQSYKQCCPISCSWMLSVPSDPEIAGKYPLPRQV